MITPREGTHRLLHDLRADSPSTTITDVVRVATEVAIVANSYARDAAVTARGKGATWRDLAAALAIRSDDPEPEISAFLLVARDKGIDSLNSPVLHWGCTTCGRTVADYGPYYEHVGDNEIGHASGCARLHVTEDAPRV